MTEKTRSSGNPGMTGIPDAAKKSSHWRKRSNTMIEDWSIRKSEKCAMTRISQRSLHQAVAHLQLNTARRPLDILGEVCYTCHNERNKIWVLSIWRLSARRAAIFLYQAVKFSNFFENLNVHLMHGSVSLVNTF